MRHFDSFDRVLYLTRAVSIQRIQRKQQKVKLLTFRVLLLSSFFQYFTFHDLFPYCLFWFPAVKSTFCNLTTACSISPYITLTLTQPNNAEKEVRPNRRGKYSFLFNVIFLPLPGEFHFDLFGVRHCFHAPKPPSTTTDVNEGLDKFVSCLDKRKKGQETI